jgi:tight adherence protein C
LVFVAILAVLLIAVAVGCAVAVVTEPRVRRAERLRLIDVYGYVAGGGDSTLEVAPARQTLDVIAGAIGDFLASRLSSLREEEVQRRLIAAGFFRIGTRRFIGYRVLLTVLLPLLLIWLLVFSGASGGVIFIFAVIGAAAGWLGPGLVLSRRARKRLGDLDYAMPELVDVLAVILEAGVAFTPALRIASERIGGPLGDELRLTIQEQTLGLSTLDSLQNWMARCAAPSVQTFVRAMVQGERLGISIGQILRNLAIEMRKRRQQAAEERAHKAAIKILFPLVILIFPAMFVVILGPALFRIMDSFG